MNITRKLGDYNLYSNCNTIRVTAQDLLDIAAWVENNRRELEAVINGDHEYLADLGEQLQMQQEDEARECWLSYDESVSSINTTT